jgi:ubiquitin C-terminal hydrolase
MCDEDILSKMPENIEDVTMDTFRLKGYQPLININNTCFVNVMLQALFHTVPLAKALLEGKYKKQASTVKDKKLLLLLHFVKMNYVVWTTNTLIRPSMFIHELAENLPGYELGHQHDAHEALIWLLDVFHECMSKTVVFEIGGVPQKKIDLMKIEAVKQWAQHYRSKEDRADSNVDPFRTQYSQILDIFGGQYLERVNCEDPSCNFINYKYASFLSSELQIQDTRPGNLDGPQVRIIESIEEALNHHCSLEKLDADNQWTCEKCKKKTQPYRRISYWKLPEILIIGLKRFRYEKKNGEFRSVKITHMVKYDPVLNMDPYVSNSFTSSTYKLYGVICHRGEPEIGHYYAYCMDVDGKWFYYNDDIVRPVDASKVVTADAYVLCYQRS